MSMLTPPRTSTLLCCSGKTAGTLMHSQCRNCRRRPSSSSDRIVHFLPPEFVNGTCPMRIQS